MRKLPVVVFLLAAIGGAVTYTSMKPDEFVADWSPTHRFIVRTTTNTLAHFAEIVGGESVGAWPIIASDIEPHEYEPTSNDVIDGLSDDLFIMNGAGVDAWADSIVQQRSDASKPSIVVLDPRIQDPHFWLDPIAVIDLVGQIRDAYIAIDPEHADEYTRNAAAYVDELTQLDAEYRATLVNCEKPEIVVAHDAFNYLAERYGFTVNAIAGISPEEEPSPSKLIELAQLMEQNNLTVVFFEETAADRTAQVLADEAGARAQVLYTGEIIPAEETYLSLMRKNLAQLDAAMVCRQ